LKSSAAPSPSPSRARVAGAAFKSRARRRVARASRARPASPANRRDDHRARVGATLDAIARRGVAARRAVARASARIASVLNDGAKML